MNHELDRASIKVTMQMGILRLGGRDITLEVFSEMSVRPERANLALILPQMGAF